MPKAILITRAAGKRGGAVLQALLDHPSFSSQSYTLNALTENAAFPLARHLAATSSVVTLVSGDFSNVPTRSGAFLLEV